METLKTLVVMVVMAGVGYGVYVSVWQKSDATILDNAPAYKPPNVQVPGLDASGSQTAGSSSVEPAQLGSVSPGNEAAAGQCANSTASNAFGGSCCEMPTNSMASSSSTRRRSDTPALLSPSAATSQASGTQWGNENGGNNMNAGPNLLTSTTPNNNPPTGYHSSAQSTQSIPTTAQAIPGVGQNVQSEFTSLMDTVQKQLEANKLSDALLTLSSLYGRPELSQTESRQLTQLLDQLAGTVIYSRKHYLEPPYIVQPGETLDQIAQRYDVPTLLLARINGIGDPQHLQPGQELKVLRGPFNAIVHLEKHELTLMLHGCYAGRFAIGLGCDQPKLEGEFTVRERTADPLYRGPDGTIVAGGDPRNPLGKYWIGLSDSIGLHGTVDPQ
ncbi:MAG: L,D-transpeptidase family protein, partial [Thermoguttaceae bacterium]